MSIRVLANVVGRVLDSITGCIPSSSSQRAAKAYLWSVNWPPVVERRYIKKFSATEPRRVFGDRCLKSNNFVYFRYFLTKFSSIVERIFTLFALIIFKLVGELQVHCVTLIQVFFFGRDGKCAYQSKQYVIGIGIPRYFVKLPAKKLILPNQISCY